MNFIIFNKFFDSTWWKIILVVFFIVIFAFTIIGLIGALIGKIFRYQEKQVDKDMGPLVVSRVCDNAKDFKKLASKKSMDRFFKVSQLPIIFLFISLILYVIYGAKYGRWNDSLIDRETGVATLLYTFDFKEFFSNFPNIDWSLIKVYAPSPYTDERIFNYFIFLFLLLGSVIYLIDVQAYVARKYRIIKMAKKVYSANLDEMDLRDFYNKDLKAPTDNNL